MYYELCDIHEPEDNHDLKLVKPKHDIDRGRVRGNSCGMDYLWQDRLLRFPIGRYSPRSHKDRFIGHLA